jgi:PHD/YefM family antitoxin component YafN of YafNO toxin-antitoxin module
MPKLEILDKAQTIRIGKEPVVLVPLRLWHQVEDLLEDQEALSSKRFLRKIAKSRKDAAARKLLYPFR